MKRAPYTFFKGALAITTKNQKEKNPSDFQCCTSSLVGVSPDGSTVKVIPLYCHKWNCPRCRKQKAHRWRQIACAGKPDKFITLTLRSDENASCREQAKKLKRSFTELVRRIRTHYGRFQYLLILELTRIGTPHCHILARCDYIPQGFLSKEWCALTGAFKVDIRKIKRTSDVSRYITKYMGKSISNASSELHGLRIIQKSKGYIIDPEFIKKENAGGIPIDVLEWSFMFVSPLEAVKRLSQLPDFYQVESEDDTVFQFRAPPRADVVEYILYSVVGEKAFRTTS